MSFTSIVIICEHVSYIFSHFRGHVILVQDSSLTLLQQCCHRSSLDIFAVTIYWFKIWLFISLFRTKALVLELLAAICLVKGGHEIILEAFDHFKEVCQEKRRFETLMTYFVNYESFHVEFMVSFHVRTLKIWPLTKVGFRLILTKAMSMNFRINVCLWWSLK